MTYQELKQMAPEEIIKLAESIDKVNSFYGEMDIGEKWDNWRNTYGGSPLATFEKNGVTYVLTDNRGDGQFTNTILDIGIFTNPITAFLLGLVGAFEDPIPKGISTPYIVKFPYKEDGVIEEVPTEEKEKKPKMPEDLIKEVIEEERRYEGLDCVSRQKKPKDNFYENLIESNEVVSSLHKLLNEFMRGYDSNKN